MVKKTYYKVTLTGEVTIEANDESDAIKKAQQFFFPSGEGLAWAVEKVEVQIKPPE